MTLEYITEKNAPTEAEIVQYMKLPLVLFKTAEFKEELSLAAKVLYCFLLDRSNLSLKNADRFTEDLMRKYESEYEPEKPKGLFSRLFR